MSIYLATFGKLRYLGLAGIEDEALTNVRWVILKTMRGLEMGLLGGRLSQEQEERYRSACLGDHDGEQFRGPEPMLQEVHYVRDADAEQIENYYRCRAEEEQILVRAREIMLEDRLSMKLVDVEYMLDRRKLFFYFTSEHRVDFRAFVRDLAREFRTRIELRQIGVRDEARVVEGIAPCGRPCCCSYWLRQFSPICIRMVKEQHLALNPTKISGICGRLMCCMAYEHPVYEELWQSLPAPGAKIKTEQGNYILDGVDLATRCAIIRFPSGRLVSVSIAEFPDFRDAVLRGEEWDDEKEAKHAEARPTFAERKLNARMSRRSRTAPVPQGGRKNNFQAQPERNSFKNSLKNSLKVSLNEHLARQGQQEDEGALSAGSSFENAGRSRSSQRRGSRLDDARPPRGQHRRPGRKKSPASQAEPQGPEPERRVLKNRKNKKNRGQSGPAPDNLDII